MLKRGFAVAAILLPLSGFVASPAHADGDDPGGIGQLISMLQGLGQGGGGGDDASAAVMEGGVRRPIVYENGEWGYRDRYGRWNRAPEAHRRYMEYHHPRGMGFNGDHRRFESHGLDPRHAEASAQHHANPSLMPASSHAGGVNPLMAHNSPLGHVATPSASPVHNIVTASAHPSAVSNAVKKH
jgi:hypothetical protein